MYNYYKGNSSRGRRVGKEERPAAGAGFKREAEPAYYESAKAKPLGPGAKAVPGGLESILNNILPGAQLRLETEDIILLLMLYLMYKDSGDKELLIIMGAILFF